MTRAPFDLSMYDNRYRHEVVLSNFVNVLVLFDSVMTVLPVRMDISRLLLQNIGRGLCSLLSSTNCVSVEDSETPRMEHISACCILSFV